VLEKKKKRAAVARGAWKPEPMTDITEEHSFDPAVRSAVS
jgi:hypothetical protein